MIPSTKNTRSTSISPALGLSLCIHRQSPPTLRQIKIKWPQLGITITADMNDKNPTLVNVLRKQLPYRSLQNHALVAGDHLYHLVPSEELIYTNADYKVPNRVTEPDGTIFLSSLQHLSIKYGPLTEYFPAAPCGQVVSSDMSKLVEAGKGIWNACNNTKQVIEAVVWDASQPEPDEHLPLRIERLGVTPEVKALVEECHVQTENSWSSLANDIQLIHKGLIRSKAGSKNSYFPTMTFINGEIRPLAYNTLNNILKLAATQPHFNLQHLITIYTTFVPVPAQFIGYTGASFVWTTCQKIEALIKSHVERNEDAREAREDFLAMVSAFARYANLLNAQCLWLFPWRHGDEYQMGRVRARL